jgi:hypothetical protein
VLRPERGCVVGQVDAVLPVWFCVEIIGTGALFGTA